MATTSRVLTGYASVFDQPTRISFADDGTHHTFYEAIRPFDFALQDPKAPSTVFLRDHSQSLILGRKGRNLTAREDDKGLWFGLDVPETALGDETLELVDREILSGCSFAFTVARDSWHEPDPNKPPLRVIEKVGALYDLSICPAYEQTSVKVGRGPGPTPEQLARIEKMRKQLADMRRSVYLKNPEKPQKRAADFTVGRRISPPPFASKLPGVVRRGCGHATELSHH